MLISFIVAKIIKTSHGFELPSGAPPAGEVAFGLAKYGLLCNAASATVLRFTPPITIEEEEADWALGRLGEGLRALIS